MLCKARHIPDALFLDFFCISWANINAILFEELLILVLISSTTLKVLYYNL